MREPGDPFESPSLYAPGTSAVANLMLFGHQDAVELGERKAALDRPCCEPDRVGTVWANRLARSPSEISARVIARHLEQAGALLRRGAIVG
jgi:hypothetical protein